MRLRKYHGLGNDYLVLEEGPPPGPALTRALCARHTGCGADGLLIPALSEVADYSVRIVNPDGREAEKSGNGLRILARWLVERRGAPERFTVETPGGVVTCRVEAEAVEVEMGRASFDPADLPMDSPAEEHVEAPLQVGAELLTATALSVGNPHCVFFRDADPESLPWRRWGRLLQDHPAFPRQVNVQLARVLGPDAIALRIWERGAGETSASGSSACAVAAAAVKTGRCDPGTLQLIAPGGSLEVTVGGDFSLRLRGPVEPVGVFEPDPRLIAAAAPA